MLALTLRHTDVVRIETPQGVITLRAYASRDGRIHIGIDAPRELSISHLHAKAVAS